MTPILSVLVISHNQRHQVQRCIESVLSQKLPFDYEIVISDDASSDGSWELEQEYAARYPFIKVFQCNSNDCNPTITSERSGYNRSNAYTHSTGKYFVHIDADDWYRPGTDCLFRQVELLETHPECSMCMQDEWRWKEGIPLDSGWVNHQLHRFQTGQTISIEDYFNLGDFVNNGVMMMRRNCQYNPALIYNKLYVDAMITAHHLQFGPIVCLDANDWIYTQSGDSITGQVQGPDSRIIWGLDLSVLASVLIPSLKFYIYSSQDRLMRLLDSVRCILSREALSSQTKRFCFQYHRFFIFSVAIKERLSYFDFVRLHLIKLLIKIQLHNKQRFRKTVGNLLHEMCTSSCL